MTQEVESFHYQATMPPPNPPEAATATRKGRLLPPLNPTHCPCWCPMRAFVTSLPPCPILSLCVLIRCSLCSVFPPRVLPGTSWPPGATLQVSAESGAGRACPRPQTLVPGLAPSRSEAESNGEGREERKRGEGARRGSEERSEGERTCCLQAAGFRSHTVQPSRSRCRSCEHLRWECPLSHPCHVCGGLG